MQDLLQRFKYQMFSIMIFLSLASPVAAQGDPWASAENFFTTFEVFLTNIAGVAAVIGFLGLAIMYMGSSFPLVSDWKQENPKASRDVVMGLVILLFVGGGGLAGMLAF